MNWYASSGYTQADQLNRQLAMQELTLEALPFLALMGLKRIKAVPSQGIRLLPAPKMDKHHIFPQQFASYFQKKGINIHNFTIAVGETTHLRGIHGMGNTMMPGRWNHKWREFIEANPKASSKEIYQFAGKLLDDYNLNHLNIQGYKK